MISLKNLLLEVSVEDLKRQFVDTGKISEKAFDAAIDATGGKSAYTTWLCKRLVSGDVREEAILDNQIRGILKNALDFFDKNKRLFTDKDINHYTKLTDFIDLCRSKREELEDDKKQKDINRFKIGAVKTADGTGYLVYKLPKGHEENQPVAIALGRHPEGYKGWCTSYDGNARWWLEHIQKEDLYIFVNPRASATDKYQIQFGYNSARPFSIKDDSPLIDQDIVPNLVPFYKFLHDHEGRPMPGYIVSEEDFLNQVNESRGTLEDLEVEPGIYKIDSNTDPDLWIGPFCKDILGRVDRSIVTMMRDRLEMAADEYAYYFVQAYNKWYNIYTMTAPSEGRILQRSRLDSYISNATRTAEDNFLSELYKKCKRVAELISCSLPVQLTLKYEPDSFPSLKEFYKGKVGKIEYYIVPGGTPFYRIFRDLQFENWKYKAIGIGSSMIGILIQEKDMILLYGLNESKHLPDIERYKNGRETNQTAYNPDILYEMYRNLKNFDDNVKFPTKLQKIDNIKRGYLNDFKVPQIGSVKTLYKIPAKHCPLIPYSIEPPYSVEEGSYTLLGFISKWQFTLSSRGGFSLTGRWGSGSNPSWIASVKGLPETLQSICKEYGIRRPDGLVEYLRRYGQES